MKPVTVHAAKTNLSKLIDLACQGEDVVIARKDKPVVKLVPIAMAIPKRQFGRYKGKFKLDETFFDPLPPEELDAWEQ